MRGFGSLNRSTRAFVALIIAAGILVIPVVWTFQPIEPTVGLELLYLAVGTQIAAMMPIRWTQSLHVVYTPLLVAAALVSPGAGVALVIWLATFDGRVPGRDLPWWAFLFNRANLAIAYGIPSLALLAIPITGPVWELLGLPVRTLLVTMAVIFINFPLTARVVGHLTGKSTLSSLIENVGLTTIRSNVIMGFVGGLLYEVLRRDVGYVMALALLGVLVAVRGNIADAGRQSQERLQTLQLAAQVLDARDPYTESHSARVAELAATLAEALGLSGRKLEELRTSGSLHDIGKIGIRDAILNKAAALTDEEWLVMKRHPVIGAEMIAQHSALRILVPMVRGHHERWNGSGYPDGLRGEAIPLGARILAVADSFDTMTSPRQYRASTMTPNEAVADVTRLAGVWYDVAVVNALRELHGMEPIGELAPLVDQPFTNPDALRVMALRPRFARLVTGMTISNLGDPMTTVAALVTVFAVTHDARTVAAAYAVKAVATILMGLVGTSIPDRANRRRLIVSLEITRATILVATPFALVQFTLWLVFPILFALAAINAVVQPARMAAIPELVETREVGAAIAAVTAAGMIAMAIGYALAGFVLWAVQSTAWLFIADGLTFAVAGIMAVGLGDLGGGSRKVGFLSGLSRTWAVHGARVHLAVAGAGSFFLSMSFPTLITLAYRRAPDSGSTAYTILEVMLASGIVVGSIVVGRMKNIGTMRTVAQGLAITGLFSVAVGLSPWLWLVAVLLLIASAGNPVYSVGNATALMEASDSGNRGTIMSSRLAITQLALVLGATTGGFVSSVIGPEATYQSLGVGLLAVAAVVGMLSRERRSVHEATP